MFFLRSYLPGNEGLPTGLASPQRVIHFYFSGTGITHAHWQASFWFRCGDLNSVGALSSHAILNTRLYLYTKREENTEASKEEKAEEGDQRLAADCYMCVAYKLTLLFLVALYFKRKCFYGNNSNL